MKSLQENPRGIPQAPFMDDVKKFVPDGDYEGILQRFQELVSKYRFMQTHALQRQESLDSKIPEIKKSLDMVIFLQTKQESVEPIEAEFELSDTLWTKARIPPTGKVNIWLGANVMLEYTIEEAKELLSSKLNSASISREQVKEDLEFLREQITTMEVNMARVYNDGVRHRRVEKETGKV
ncbi:hypothetical protein BASA50_005168 [Batrachochytrium salamandrivorans]|uniref:Prefoldin subunit 3 n=1 Tax=Batrachochytrium salamandrivorans TaxID=1357716 RepID=A0ABQ8FDN6_9FUNG|nr:hypothetical protein BASA62_000333 [Batrachochytrium salamandrivorans]KAH6596463.1 hypothetical protein BASA50_005168 [Batrachochytrium salamandrivorans]KAH9250638.1 hypothetical protein BASA81_011558 [Batrachochytrium salamandrivorans]KAH9275553.1 hypothetical protein BASA83_001835 [Batrachochytrium salamandrivorans]